MRQSSQRWSSCSPRPMLACSRSPGRVVRGRPGSHCRPPASRRRRLSRRRLVDPACAASRPGARGRDRARPLGSTNGLAEHIADKRMLCLFDNFEQSWSRLPSSRRSSSACPNLDVLVTSRERLRVSGEQTYPVPPLAETDGEELFITRARAVDPAFVASDAVPELCLRLDELPLALELAAARTSIFTPEQLLERLAERLDLLKGEPRRRSPPADVACNDRVVVTTCSPRTSSGSFAGSPSSPEVARTRPQRRSLAPTPTRSSRFSTRASCASAPPMAPATGCSRRSASTQPSSSTPWEKPRTWSAVIWSTTPPSPRASTRVARKAASTRPGCSRAKATTSGVPSSARSRLIPSGRSSSRERSAATGSGEGVSVKDVSSSRPRLPRRPRLLLPPLPRAPFRVLSRARARRCRSRRAFRARGARARAEAWRPKTSGGRPRSSRERRVASRRSCGCGDAAGEVHR